MHPVLTDCLKGTPGVNMFVVHATDNAQHSLTSAASAAGWMPALATDGGAAHNVALHHQCAGKEPTCTKHTPANSYLSNILHHCWSPAAYIVWRACLTGWLRVQKTNQSSMHTRQHTCCKPITVVGGHITCKHLRCHAIPRVIVILVCVSRGQTPPSSQDARSMGGNLGVAGLPTQ